MHMLDDGTVIEQTDASLGVRFFLYPQQDIRRSNEEGRPIFYDKEMVEILIPGSRDKLHKEVTEDVKRRFRKRYEAWKEASDNKVDGTPLTEFPFISSAERKELEYFNIFTGEQLINMADGYIDKVGVNGRDLIKKVKNYMTMAKDSSLLGKITSENEQLKREMAMLKEQMQHLLSMGANTAGMPKEPKRNKKHEKAS